MPRKPRWYDPLPEATATVDCGGEQHRVTWRRGKVVLEDHDLDAERGMMAFGGEMCPCMRVLEVWVEQFRMPPDLFGQMHTWLGDQAFLLPTELALPRRMGFVQSWERAWRFESYLPTKHLYDRHLQIALEVLGNLVERGVRQGSFRDLHPRLVAEVLDAAGDRIRQPDVLARAGVTRSEAIAELSSLFRQGLIAEGRRAGNGRRSTARRTAS